MEDPHLQIREGGVHLDPEKGSPVSKLFFSALRSSVWSKNKGMGPSVPFPWIRHCVVKSRVGHVLSIGDIVSRSVV